MTNRTALIAIVVALFSACDDTSAFVVNKNTPSNIKRPLFSTIEDNTITNAYQQVTDMTASSSTTVDNDSKLLIMDIPPSPIAQTGTKTTTTPPPAGGTIKKNPAHKEGIFSPLVIAAGTILGPDQLNKIRAKVISLHSDIIKSFVDTSDSTFGKAVLQQLFTVVDTDSSGYIDKHELSVALSLLGFKWLKNKQVDGIFERADVNADGMISLEEFMNEAPKTLKTNLVKLAKNNGGDMGLLV
jgi:hypothetical protein